MKCIECKKKWCWVPILNPKKKNKQECFFKSEDLSSKCKSCSNKQQTNNEASSTSSSTSSSQHVSRAKIPESESGATLIMRVQYDKQVSILNIINDGFFYVSFVKESETTVNLSREFYDKWLKYYGPTDNILKVKFYDNDVTEYMEKYHPQAHDFHLDKQSFLSLLSDNGKLSLPALNFVLKLFNLRNVLASDNCTNNLPSTFFGDIIDNYVMVPDKESNPNIFKYLEQEDSDFASTQFEKLCEVEMSRWFSDKPKGFTSSLIETFETLKMMSNLKRFATIINTNKNDCRVCLVIDFCDKKTQVPLVYTMNHTNSSGNKSDEDMHRIWFANITEGKWVVVTFLCRWDIFMSKIDIKNSTPFDLKWGGSATHSSLSLLPLGHETHLKYLCTIGIFNLYLLI